MKRTLVVASLLVACSHGGSKPVASNAPAARGAVAPCPEGAALEQTARAAWQQGPGKVGPVMCLAFHADGQDLWLIEGVWESDDPDTSMAVLGTAVVTPEGERRFEEHFDAPIMQALDSTIEDPRAVDLDGDGNDELVMVTSTMRGGYLASTLVVLRFAGDDLASLGEVAYEEDNAAADPAPGEEVACSSSHRLVDAVRGQHVIEITAHHEHGGDCLPEGTHRFGLHEGKLTELVDEVSTPG